MSDIVDKLRNLGKVHAAECLPANSTGAALERLIQDSSLTKAAHEIERLRQRIEELEEYIRQHVGVTECVDFHKISTTQIDAAWGNTEKLRASLKNLGQFEIESLICNVREELMKELSIVRCECPQIPKVDIGWAEGLKPVCPACNGKGWVMEADDE
jgi:translation initiation factor 2B subunit (eIF-2B alpha/beta/delta family)